MPFFTYTALKAGKDIINGKIEANNLKEAREFLRRMDLTPTKIQEQIVVQKKKAKEKQRRVKIGRIGIRDKIEFTNTLYILSKTGISLLEALLFIEVNSGSKKVQKISSELRRQVLAGSNLSDAVNKYPETFDDIYAGLIKTGEQSGELETTLQRMAELLDKQEKLSNKIKMTLLYPCFVIFLSMAVTIVMLTFVFPAFKDMYSQMGKDLPFITKILMDTGVFLRTYWITIPLVFLLLGVSIYFLFKWPTFRQGLDKLSLKIPVIQKFVKLANLSNFVAVLRVSFEAGIPIHDGLVLANQTVQNNVIRSAFKDSSIKIQHGHSLSTSLKLANVIPGIIMCMISTGEQSGQLGDMLYHAGLYIDAQLDRTIEILNKLFEPILLVIIGSIVLILGLALYMPLFQSYTNMV